MKKTRFLSLLLAMSLIIGMFSSTTVFASEADSASKNSTVMTDSKTPEISPRATSFGPGDWDWGGVTFYDENGGAYKTINGNQVKIKVAFKAVDGDSASYHLYLDFVEYGGRYVYSRDYNSWSVAPDGDGFYYYESDWINVNKGVDSRFLYGANSECACNDPRRLEVHIWIEVR